LWSGVGSWAKGAPTTAEMRSLVLLVASLLCLGGGASASTDFRFPAVFNFGDSNSDTGGRVAAGFESILPPYGATFFGTPSGRFCDGRLIIDFLSTLASRIPLSVWHPFWVCVVWLLLICLPVRRDCLVG
jgi:hypothetical protein